MSFIYNRTQQICKQIPTPSSGDIIPIYEPSIISGNDTVTGLRYNGYITDLRIRSVVESLPETPLPEFELGESRTQKMATMRDLEYKSPRYALEVLLSYSNSPYLPIFEFSMHNRKPFFITEVTSYLTNQPALALAPDAALAVRFIDVGYGYPKATDSFVVYGCAREESIHPSVAPGTNLSTHVLPLTYAPKYPQLMGSWPSELRVLAGAGLAFLSFEFSSTSPPAAGDLVLSWDEQYRCSIPQLLVSPEDPPNYPLDGSPFFFVIQGNELRYPAQILSQSAPVSYAVRTIAFPFR